MRLPGINDAVSCIADEVEFACARRRRTSSPVMRVAGINMPGSCIARKGECSAAARYGDVLSNAPGSRSWSDSGTGMMI
jgi:hypothetical protein